jgi:hypothetical protein
MRQFLRRTKRSRVGYDMEVELKLVRASRSTLKLSIRCDQLGFAENGLTVVPAKQKARLDWV